MSDHQLQDKSNDRVYFSMLPNMLDDLLDPYQYRLYAHIKRVCGENDGTCWQSTATMAEQCRMSVGKISEVKHELQEMGLIHVQEKARPNGGLPYHLVTIVDIWQRNLMHCTSTKRPSSQSEQASSPDEQASSQGETKKNPLKEKPKHGADAQRPDDLALFHGDGDQHEPERHNPAQERLARMRAKFGDHPVQLSRVTEQARQEQTLRTVPEDIPKSNGKSPAVLEFKRATGYMPPTPWRDSITDYVGAEPADLQRWYDTCYAWVGCGWNPRNAKGMLDYYILKEVPGTKGVSPMVNNGEQGMSADMVSR